MKKFFTLVVLALLAVGCAKEYDDTGVRELIAGLDLRVSELEANVSALQSALGDGKFVRKVEEYKDPETGRTTGVTVTYTDGNIVHFNIVPADPTQGPVFSVIRNGASELVVLSNAKWTVTKESATDDWFEILTPTGEGNGKIQLSFTQNDGDGLRSAVIILKNVVAHEEDYAATKEIVVKQAYKITPVRVMFNADELGSWSSDWTNAPTYSKDLGGTLFNAKARLHNGSKPFGN